MFATERRPGWMALALAMAVLPIAAEARDRAKVIPLASVETGTATGLGAGLGAVEVRSPEPRAAEVRSGFEARGLHATGVTGDVTVVVDRAKIIRLPEKTQTVVIGNPAVADISIQKNGVVVLTGKSFGVTNFIAMDSAGNQIAEAKVSVTAPSDATLHRPARARAADLFLHADLPADGPARRLRRPISARPRARSTRTRPSRASADDPRSIRSTVRQVLSS